MDVPSLDQIRLRSPLLTSEYPSPDGDAALAPLVSDSAAIIMMFTGRLIGVTSGTGPFGCPLEEVTPELVPVVTRAIAFEAEIISIQFSAAQRQAQIEQGLGGLASFTAGPYSESYFQPGSGNAASTKQLVPDPFLDSLLWEAMTDCARAGWLNKLDPTRPYAPAYALETQDWFPEGPAYPYGLPAYRGGGFFFGPDGF